MTAEIDELTAADLHHAQVKQEVEEWMDAEGRALRLRRNDEAPMWRDYLAAVERKAAAEAAVARVEPRV